MLIAMLQRIGAKAHNDARTMMPAADGDCRGIGAGPLGGSHPAFWRQQRATRNRSSGKPQGVG